MYKSIELESLTDGLYRVVVDGISALDQVEYAAARAFIDTVSMPCAADIERSGTADVSEFERRI